MEKINHIVSLLGKKFLVINILLLILWFAIVCSFVKNRVLRLILALIFGVFTVLQISSLYFVRTFIGYNFIIHFNKRDVEGMLGLFSYEIILFVVLLLVFVLLFFYSSIIIERVVRFLKDRITIFSKILKESVIKFSKAAFVLLAFVIMSLNNGVFSESYLLFKTMQVDDIGFKENLLKLGIKDYVTPDKLEVSAAKKNLIVISLESYERAFLSDKYSHLTPYLRSLRDSSNWSYFNMKENEGSKWTSGSLYTSLTGFPAYFGTYHNEIFQSSYNSNITGISHILKKAGYKTMHLSSDASVSGTDDMLFALDVDHIIDKTQLKEKTQDKDLFDKAKQKIFEHTKSSSPFALFMATLSTHFPNGVYDSRMEGIVPSQNTDLEFMIASVDYMLKEFIDYLKSTNQLSNTVIYIFPDHLKMGDDRMFFDTGKRGLFVLTNAKEDDFDFVGTEDLYQIDLPKLILDGATINHNAKFLTEYIEGDKNDFIKDHITEITSLNVSGFSRVKKQPYIIPKITAHYDTYKKDTNRFIAHAGGMIDNLIYTNSLEALNLSYKKGFRLFELDIQKTKDGKYVAAHYWDEWATITNYQKETPVTHEEFMKHKIYDSLTPLDMKAINKWFKEHKDAILVTDKINEPKLFSDQFIDKKRLMMELFTWEAVLEGIDVGIKSSMVSQRVLNNLKGNKVKTLKKYHITDIAISRNIIASNIELLKELKKNGIKVYVYNVNGRIDRDEDYVVKYEMDYVYGIYADKWNFNK